MSYATAISPLIMRGGSETRALTEF